MSGIVFFIAALPALCVYLVGLYSYARGNLYTAAAIAGVVGVVTGNPIYAVFDVFSVLIGLYLGYQAQSSRIKSKRLEDERRDRLEERELLERMGFVRCPEMDAKVAEMKVKREARLAELLRLKAEKQEKAGTKVDVKNSFNK